MAGSLLSPGLDRGVGNLGTGLGLLCALAIVCQLLHNGLMDKVCVDLNAEKLIGKLHGADLGAFHVFNCYASH